MCQVKKLVNIRLEDRGASPPPSPKKPQKTKQNKTWGTFIYNHAETIEYVKN